MSAEAETAAPAGSSTGSFLERHHHLLRRLHSLSGVVPIGAFLFPHLATNSSVVWGAALNANKFKEMGIDQDGAGVATFQHEVDFIHGLPFLVFIEVCVLWLPLAFHALLGVHYARSGKPNVDRYRYQDNIRYSLQRVSGYIGFLFIFLHVSSLRWGWTYGGLLPTFEAHNAASSTAAHLQSGTTGLLLAGFYLVCVLALVFHFANGLWTAAITWGLTISVGAQRRWGYVCFAIGLALAAAAVASVAGFATLDVQKAKEIEGTYNRASAHAAADTEPPVTALQAAARLGAVH